MSFVTHAQNKDASAFRSLVEERLAEKVVQVLDGLKAEVASNMFSEEGGVSGGVPSVKKKPSPPAAGAVKLPGQGGKEGGLTHAGRSGSSDGEKSAEAILPGSKVTEATVKKGSGGSPEKEPEGDRAKGGKTFKKPHLSSKPEADRKGFKESFTGEFLALNQKLEEARIVPGSEDHMAHHVHAMHIGDLPRGLSGQHVETKHYHIHHTGVELGTDSRGDAADTHVYHVVPKGSGVVHKFHVTASNKQPGAHHVVHMGSM